MPVELVLSLDEQGQFNMKGPIGNAPLVYGLLGMANQVMVARAVAPQNEKQIHLAPAGLADAFKQV